MKFHRGQLLKYKGVDAKVNGLNANTRLLSITLLKDCRPYVAGDELLINPDSIDKPLTTVGPTRAETEVMLGCAKEIGHAFLKHNPVDGGVRIRRLLMEYGFENITKFAFEKPDAFPHFFNRLKLMAKQQ